MKFIENIKITKLGHGGIGIAIHTDGRKILIKGGPLPGSIVDIRIVKSKADHIEGHITKIHYIDPEYTDGEILCPHYIYDQSGINTNESSPERLPHKTGCGGCKRQIINYNKQLLIKKQLVEESFDIINKKSLVKLIDNLPESRREDLRNINLEMLKNEPGAFGPIEIKYKKQEEKDQQYWERAVNVNKKFYLEYQNKIIGVMGCGIRKNENGENLDIGGIRGVYINPSYRGQGWSKKLMDNCIIYMYKNLGITRTTLRVSKTETPAIKFYEKYGYKKTKDISNEDGGFLYEGYEMEYIYNPESSNISESNKHAGSQKGSDNSYSINITNPIPSPKIRGYRNKIEFSFGKYIVKNERLSEWSAGFHKQGEFAKIVDIDQCFLIDNKLNSVYKYLKNILKETGFDVYDQKFHRGVFRHLMLRQGQNTDEIMAVLALSDKYISSPNDILRIKEILKSNEFLNQHITTMVLVVNNGLGDIMFAPDSILENLRGNGYIYETLNIDSESLKFKISPQSFFQTNTSGAEVLFETGINILKSKLADKGGLLIDLYCGAGTIGLSMMAGGMFDKVIGVDIVKSSIDDAMGNAAANNMSDKSEFHCGKAEDIVKKLDKINNLKAIVIDPPREGLHPDVIKFLIDLKHKQDYKLLYISCNPVTMARDISMLLDSDKFFTDTIQPMDMFPHTHHIENISILD